MRLRKARAVLKISRDPFVYKKSSARQRARTPPERYFNDLTRHCSGYVVPNKPQGCIYIFNVFDKTRKKGRYIEDFGCCVLQFPNSSNSVLFYKTTLFLLAADTFREASVVGFAGAGA